MRKPTLAMTVACLAVGSLAACSSTEPTPPTGAVTGQISVPEPNGPRSDNRAAVLSLGEQLVAVGDRVYFAYDSSVLAADAQRILQRQAAWLRERPTTTLTIEGHADERGTREYNLALGARRADAVRDFLIAQGVAGDRLRTLSYGKERPQIAGSDEASWAQNRRGVSVPR